MSTPITASPICRISSIQSMPLVRSAPMFQAIQVPSRAARMPTMIVTRMEMRCRPGAKSRPRRPMMAPTTIALMMPPIPKGDTPLGIGGIISAIVVGAIIGLLGRLFAPGRQRISILVTIIVGILAALLGTWIAWNIGAERTSGIDWIELILQIGLAVIGVLIAARMLGSGRRTVV